MILAHYLPRLFREAFRKPEPQPRAEYELPNGDRITAHNDIVTHRQAVPDETYTLVRQYWRDTGEPLGSKPQRRYRISNLEPLNAYLTMPHTTSE